MKKAEKFEDLILWQKAHSLVLTLYKLSHSFPKEEMFGLTSQLRRAAVSIPANIAEGFVKQSEADKARYLNIAQGSLEEVKYYLEVLSNFSQRSRIWRYPRVKESIRRSGTYSECLSQCDIAGRC